MHLSDTFETLISYIYIYIFVLLPLCPLADRFADDVSVLCGLFLAFSCVPTTPPALLFKQPQSQVLSVLSPICLFTFQALVLSSSCCRCRCLCRCCGYRWSMQPKRKKEAPARAHVKWPRGPVSPFVLYPWSDNCQLSPDSAQRSWPSSLCLRLRHLRTGDVNNCTTVRSDANKWLLLPPLCLCLCHAARNKLLPLWAGRGVAEWACCGWDGGMGEDSFWDLSIGAGHAQWTRPSRRCWLPDISKETPFDVDTIIASGDATRHAEHSDGACEWKSICCVCRTFLCFVRNGSLHLYVERALQGSTRTTLHLAHA